MESLVRPDLISLAAHIVGAALFGAVFTFLYRELRIVYFSYWALAWGLLSAGLLFQLAAVFGRGLFLLPYALLQLAFAVSLIFAGASVSTRSESRLSSAILLLPVLALGGYAASAFSEFKGFHALHSLLLSATFGWSFLAFRRRRKAASGTGRKLFAACLLANSLLYGHYGLVYSWLGFTPSASLPAYLSYHDLYELMLEILLAFSAMMMWMEAQNEQLLQANDELARSRQEIARHFRLDPLTGLWNRAALDETCESGEPVSGVVAVIDLDNFKDVNDALGHLAGDEVLASVGNLIRTSVRKEDWAWRWGGDEFVVLFREQTMESAEERLRNMSQRLLRFRLRGKGVLPVNMSWGTALLANGSLRQAIEEADQQMYLKKRDKVSPSKFFGGA